MMERSNKSQQSIQRHDQTGNNQPNNSMEAWPWTSGNGPWSPFLDEIEL
jgi:hypothetical protein